MKTMLRVVPASLGIAIMAAVLAPGASAGCADVPGRPAAALEPNQHSYLLACGLHTEQKFRRWAVR